MTAYYNENEPFAAAWLRNLIAAGHIAHGHVDSRSIAEVQPADLAGYRQCHFFAGVGVWSLALRWAGWADTREVWTGSCPCQPFSTAGKQAGFADPRHVWPHWHRLIEQCRPATIFGEQVASAAQWLALVRSDLEALDYAVGAIPIEAASVGALHKRDRFWFVAHANSADLRQQSGRSGGARWEGAPLIGQQGPQGTSAHAHGEGEHDGAVYAEVAGTPTAVAHAACERRGQAGRDAAGSAAARREGAGDWSSDAGSHVAHAAAQGQPDDRGCEVQAGARRQLAACVCGCGALRTTYGYALLSGRFTSCAKCGWKKGTDQTAKKKTLPNGTGALRVLLASYKASAHRRGLSYTLSEDLFRRLVTSNCAYCGAAPSRIKKSGGKTGVGGALTLVCNGIDRRDSRGGYDSGNVIACCSTCNYAKRDLPLDIFLDWVERVYVRCVAPAARQAA